MIIVCCNWRVVRIVQRSYLF